MTEAPSFTLPTIEAPLNFSEAAIIALKRIQSEGDIPADMPLRVGVKGGGCSGLSYVLDFESVTEFDRRFVVDGLEMVIDKRHELYLAGMTVDFNDGLNARGFVFLNPNAKTTCGCGTSFSA